MYLLNHPFILITAVNEIFQVRIFAAVDTFYKLVIIKKSVFNFCEILNNIAILFNEAQLKVPPYHR